MPPDCLSAWIGHCCSPRKSKQDLLESFYLGLIFSSDRHYLHQINGFCPVTHGDATARAAKIRPGRGPVCLCPWGWAVQAAGLGLGAAGSCWAAQTCLPLPHPLTLPCHPPPAPSPPGKGFSSSSPCPKPIWVQPPGAP